VRYVANAVAFDEVVKTRYAAMTNAELLTIVDNRGGDYTAQGVEIARATLAERGVDQWEVERRIFDRAMQAHLATAEHARVGRALEAAADRAARSLTVCPGCGSRSPSTSIAFTVRGTGLLLREKMPAEVLPLEIAETVGRTDRYTLRLGLPLCDPCLRRLAPGRPPRLPLFLIAWLLATVAIAAPLIWLTFHFEETLKRHIDSRFMSFLSAPLPMLLGAYLAAVPIYRLMRRERRLARLHPFWPRLSAAGFGMTPSDRFEVPLT